MWFQIVVHSILQERIVGSETNIRQQMLRNVTRKLISTVDDLMDFGLHLGFTYEMIIHKRTNHPGSVEGAAMDLACHWWDHSTETVDWKKRKLCMLCKELKKEHLRAGLHEVLEQYVDPPASSKVQYSQRSRRGKRPGYKPY